VKAHLLSSENPIVAGETLPASCGKEISNLKIECVWDTLEVGSQSIPLSTILFCGKCVQRLQPSGKRYVYAVTSSER
jgi:hypothetical protein